MVLSIVGGFTLSLWGPLGRGRRTLVVLVEKPILLGVIQRVDHLRHELVLLCDLQHGAGVLVTSAVVCCRENREELAASETFEAIHDALMSSQDVAASVCLEEILYSVGAELHDISCTVRVSDEVWLNA